MNYKLSISKSKNARIFYIQTSYRKGAKVCTKTVKKLGNETFIKETYGVEDAEAWAALNWSACGRPRARTSRG